jgi:hypothetical protein
MPMIANMARRPFKISAANVLARQRRHRDVILERDLVLVALARTWSRSGATEASLEEQADDRHHGEADQPRLSAISAASFTVFAAGSAVSTTKDMRKNKSLNPPQANPEPPEANPEAPTENSGP